MWLINDRALWNHHLSSQQRQKRKRFSHQKRSWDSCTRASASSFLTIECANFLLAICSLSVLSSSFFIKFNSFLHIVIPRKQFLLITESVPRDRLERLTRNRAGQGSMNMEGISLRFAHEGRRSSENLHSLKQSLPTSAVMTVGCDYAP